ncbi:hypothetical protein N7444_012327 [Penicillium canescens]|nr:hypothetical protein N7444_012327 [Penicillium canescens]
MLRKEENSQLSGPPPVFNISAHIQISNYTPYDTSRYLPLFVPHGFGPQRLRRRLRNDIVSRLPPQRSRRRQRRPHAHRHRPSSIGRRNGALPPGSQTQHTTVPLADVRTSTEARKSSVTDKAGDWDSGIAAWKSKRAQEDIHRALEFVVDKDFTLNEFGDPFDERDLQEKLL